MMTELSKKFWTAHAIKHTKQRELVLDILENLSKPASAEDIYLKASKTQTKLNLSTVYRILELFYSKNIVMKNTLSGTQTAIYELNRHTHKHYMVCVKCQNIFPLEDSPCELVEKYISERTGFQVIEHKLEILGYCPHCK